MIYCEYINEGNDVKMYVSLHVYTIVYLSYECEYIEEYS